MRLRGIVFDLDGTLVHQELDFEAMRREIGVPSGTPLLETLAALSEPDRARAWQILDDHERRAALQAEAFPRVPGLLTGLAPRALRLRVPRRHSPHSLANAVSR